MEHFIRSAMHSLRYWFIALPALLSVFFLPISFFSIAQSKMLLIMFTLIVGGALFVVVRGYEGFLRIPKSWVLALCALVPLAYVVSALGAFSSTSFFGSGSDLDTVMAMFFVFCLAIVSALVIRDERDGEHFLTALTLGGVFASLVYVVQMWAPSFLSFLTIPAVAQSSVGGWHEAAIVAGLSLALVVIMLPQQVHVRARALWGLAGLFLFGILVVLGSADVWYGVAGFLALFSLLSATASHRLNPVWATTLKGVALHVVVALCALLCGVFAASLHAGLPQMLKVENVEVRPSWQGTYEVTQSVFQNREALFLGSGPNTFARQWGMFKPLSVNATQFWNADFPFGIGFVPTSVITVGVFGLIAWLVIFCALVGALYRLLSTGASPRNIRSLLLLSAIYLAGYLIAYTPGLAVVALFFVCVGVVTSLATPDSFVLPLSRTSSHSPLVWSGIALVAVVVIGFSVQGGKILFSNVYLNKAITRFATSQNVTEASALVQKALVLYPSNDRAHRSAIELGFIQLQQEAQANPSNAAGLKTILDATIQHGLSAVATDPKKYENWLVLAQFYRSMSGAGVQGADTQARSAFERAYEAQPRNPYPLIALAEMDIAINDATSTRAHLEQAIGVKPDLAAAHYMLSRLNAVQGRFQEALDQGVMTAQLAPQDPLAWFNVGSLLYAGGDYPSARQALEQATKLQKDYSDAMFMLALTYHKLGAQNEALTLFQQILVLNPGNPTVLQAIAELQKPASKPRR